jgi:hypothetical protein
MQPSISTKPLACLQRTPIIIFTTTIIAPRRADVRHQSNIGHVWGNHWGSSWRVACGRHGRRSSSKMGALPHQAAHSSNVVCCSFPNCLGCTSRRLVLVLVTNDRAAQLIRYKKMIPESFFLAIPTLSGYFRPCIGLKFQGTSTAYLSRCVCYWITGSKVPRALSNWQY